jgi:hypothetical protein
MVVRGTLTQRFEEKFIPEPNSGCWLWTASVNHKGYGEIGVRASRIDVAHRVSWRLHRGPIPDGLLVLHKCDVRCCVNPDHLFLGTNDDNMEDMRRKGRARGFKGEMNCRCRLTAGQVLAIRADRRLQREIAADYGVLPNHISNIKNRVVWSHLS